MCFRVPRHKDRDAGGMPGLANVECRSLREAAPVFRGLGKTIPEPPKRKGVQPAHLWNRTFAFSIARKPICLA
jgi:hypothetical protein